MSGHRCGPLISPFARLWFAAVGAAKISGKGHSHGKMRYG
jgi:hypothetical protein